MSRFDISYFTSFNGQYIATIVDKMTHESKIYAKSKKAKFEKISAQYFGACGSEILNFAEFYHLLCF